MGNVAPSNIGAAGAGHGRRELEPQQRQDPVHGAPQQLGSAASASLVPVQNIGKMNSKLLKVPSGQIGSA
jgi:hypothetical protein